MKKRICKFCGGDLRKSWLLGESYTSPVWRCWRCNTTYPRTLTAAEEANQIMDKHRAPLKAVLGKLSKDGMFEGEVEGALLWLNSRKEKAVFRIAELAYWLECIWMRMRYADTHPISCAYKESAEFCERRNIDYEDHL